MHTRLLPAALLLALSTPALAEPLSYSGELFEHGLPANGNYDLRLTVFGADHDTAPLALPVELTDVQVTDGRFRVDAEFGALLKNGRPIAPTVAWLDVAVREAGSSDAFDALARREKVSFDKAAGTCWSTTGDNGIDPALNFLGTLDAQPLELRVGNRRTARFEPSAISPNILQGNPANTVAAGVRGATLAGGGAVFNTDPDVDGELPNSIFDGYGTIGGGAANEAGNDNGARFDAAFATVGGGQKNIAGARHATVAGGSQNDATAVASTIAGGDRNDVRGPASSIGGGSDNRIAQGFFASTIAGGVSNEIEAERATIGGGDLNIVTATHGTIAGGAKNRVEGPRSTVGGGENNLATASTSVVAGGLDNIAFGNQASVGGGSDNQALSQFSTVSGGLFNITASTAATVSGGISNCAGGNASWAGGEDAVVRGGPCGTAGSDRDDNSFVWSDGSGTPFSSSTDNQFSLRATGGTRIFSSAALSTGVFLRPGSGAWESVSDRNAKHQVEAVDARKILDAVVALPIARWSYIAEQDGTRHIGPMAQDFSAAFAVGSSERTISTVDADGVALAAIQGLNAKLDADNARQRDMLAAQQVRIDALEARLGAMEAMLPARDAQPTFVWQH